MKRILNWFIDKWLAGFITATIFFIAKVYYDLPADKKTNFFNFKWLFSILNYPINLWKVFVLIFFLLSMLILSRWRAKQILKYRPKQKKIPNDPVFQYTVDTFGVNKATWTWSYDYDFNNNKILVKDVTPVCPECNYKMEIDTFFNTKAFAICTKCRLEGRQYHQELMQNDSDVQQEIIRRLKSGEWIAVK